MDIRTLFVANAVSNLAFALGIFLYVKGQHSIHHSIAIWGKLRFLAGLGMVLLALRGEWIPVPIVIVAANALSFTAFTLTVIAFKSCLGKPVPRLPGTTRLLIGFSMLWIVLLRIGVPENVRIAMFSTFFSIGMLIVAKDLASGWSGNSILRKFLSAVIPCFALFSLIRGAHALLHPLETVFSSSSAQVVAMLVGYIVSVTASFGFLLLAKEQTDRELERLAGTDPLTGLPNRRSFHSMAETVFSLEKRSGKAVSLLVLDIGHFKRINDSHGHDAGDRVLVEFAGILRRVTRQCDFLVRLGGEEFGVLMPETSPESAREAAERIRLAVEGCTLDTGQGVVRFTVSIGVYGEASASGPDMEHYFRSADAALYRAKDLGRNRVFVSAQS